MLKEFCRQEISLKFISFKKSIKNRDSSNLFDININQKLFQHQIFKINTNTLDIQKNNYNFLFCNKILIGAGIEKPIMTGKNVSTIIVMVITSY